VLEGALPGTAVPDALVERIVETIVPVTESGGAGPH
jgi:hypothetical protein